MIEFQHLDRMETCYSRPHVYTNLYTEGPRCFPLCSSDDRNNQFSTHVYFILNVTLGSQDGLKCRPDTSQMQRRRLPPCSWSLPWCPWKRQCNTRFTGCSEILAGYFTEATKAIASMPQVIALVPLKYVCNTRFTGCIEITAGYFTEATKAIAALEMPQ